MGADTIITYKNSEIEFLICNLNSSSWRTAPIFTYKNSEIEFLICNRVSSSGGTDLILHIRIAKSLFLYVIRNLPRENLNIFYI